jgi:hypothetical protein
MKVAGLTLLLAACSGAPSPSDGGLPDGGTCVAPTLPPLIPTLTGTLGDSGILHFGWNSFVSDQMTTPLAVGSHLKLFVTGNASISSIALVDPTLATFTGGPTSATVTGVKAGLTRLVAYDSTHTPIDSTMFTVANIDGIGFAGDWHGDPGPTIVAGSTERMRVRLFGGSTELVGFGATTFTYSGAVLQGVESQAPVEALPNTEEVFFEGLSPGTGSLTATAGTATVTLPVTYITSTAVDAIDLRLGPVGPCSIPVYGTLRAGGKEVYGQRCVWTHTGASATDWSTPFWLDEGGWPGDHPEQQYVIWSGKPSDYSVTCAVYGVNATLSGSLP